MDVLLDSNIWRYLVDANATGTLQAIESRTRNRVVIAPAVLYEALRMKDPGLRRQLAEVMTRPAWRRLMPDAYSEAEEFKREVQRLRPMWVREHPDLTYYRRVRSDWKRSRGGFWDRARQTPEREHEYIHQLDRGTVDRARENARRQRQGVSDLDRSTLEKPLDAIVGRPAEPIEGWAGAPVGMWRLHARSYMTMALLEEGSAHHEWLSGELDVRLALFRSDDWTRFWLYEVEASRMPRLWLRSAFEFMQAFYKVTDGTPVDAQIGSYATEVDMIVSGDKRFVEMCRRCRREAPFWLADAETISGGRGGVEQLFEIIRR